MNKTEIQKRLKYLDNIITQSIYDVEFPFGIVKGVQQEIDRLNLELEKMEKADA